MIDRNKGEVMEYRHINRLADNQTEKRRQRWK